MKILLTASSRHGATDEVAAVIAEQLRAAGLEVDHTRPEDVADVEGYDAFVLGSAVYMTSSERSRIPNPPMPPIAASQR